MVEDFMSDPNAATIVCGGTSATIVSRVLNRKLDVSLDYVDPEIPPIAYMDGVDLVTEGVLTLNRVLQLLRRYVKNETVSEDFFEELDKPNGGLHGGKDPDRGLYGGSSVCGKGHQQCLSESGSSF